MILANYISTELTGFSKVENDTIKTIIKTIFGEVTVLPSDYEPIIELLKYDKKNEHGNINFVLLEDMGKPKVNCQVSNDIIIKAFEYYKA